MTLILRIFSFINLALRRLAAQWGLALAILFGLVVSISLVLSVPLYADSIYHRALLERIFESSTTAVNEIKSRTRLIKDVRLDGLLSTSESASSSAFRAMK